MAENLQQLLRERAHEQTIAVRHHDETWTWEQYVDEACAEAHTLIDLADPDRPLHVGVLLGNTPEMLRSMAAAALGGYVLVGLNTTRRDLALAADIARSECQILLVADEYRHLLDGLDLRDVRVVGVDSDEWRAVAAGAGTEELVPHTEVEAMDTFMMIFTSGTSGEPKAVQVAHLMVLFAGLDLVGRVSLTPEDVCYISMPLFHSNAVVAGWGIAVAGGATMVPAKFSASQFLDDVRRYDVTYANYVGKPLAYVLATPPGPDDADNSLRVAFGNEASDRDIDDFARRFGCRVIDGFGSTELAIIITREDGTPPGSVGKGREGVAIYNADTGQECAVAQFDEHGALSNADQAVGELVNTQGAGYFQGYYKDETATDDRMRDGMFWSGDLAYRDSEGWIYLAGRTADWMRVDGENLAAAPIERVLQRLESLSRVAVYAVRQGKDEVGDQVMAAMVLRDGASLSEAEFEAFLADQADLSPKAWPRFVRIAADLPSTATNKILKRELIAEGPTAGAGTLWVRAERGTSYTPA
ncbi:fatty-acid--CoA ligase FadD1 [Nocardioides salsibiostraticola]